VVAQVLACARSLTCRYSFFKFTRDGLSPQSLDIKHFGEVALFSPLLFLLLRLQEVVCFPHAFAFLGVLPCRLVLPRALRFPPVFFFISSEALLDDLCFSHISFVLFPSPRQFLCFFGRPGLRAPPPLHMQTGTHGHHRTSLRAPRSGVEKRVVFAVLRGATLSLRTSSNLSNPLPLTRTGPPPGTSSLRRQRPPGYLTPLPPRSFSKPPPPRL